MAQGHIAKYNCQQLSDYLLSNGIREEVAEAFQANVINGDAFFSLLEDDLKELLPVIGDRILIKKLLNKLHEVYVAIIYTCCGYCIERFGIGVVARHCMPALCAGQADTGIIHNRPGAA